MMWADEWTSVMRFQGRIWWLHMCQEPKRPVRNLPPPFPWALVKKKSCTRLLAFAKDCVPGPVLRHSCVGHLSRHWDHYYQPQWRDEDSEHGEETRN